MNPCSLKVLETPAKDRFERLTRLAKHMFDLPMAYVTLAADNPQWFQSSTGFNADPENMDNSFCSHTIHSSSTFLVPDASKDKRFANHPLVIGEPYIRFYMGRSLRHHNNTKLGTLCMVDTKPRQMSKQDLLTLDDLAELAEHELIASVLASIDDLTGLSNRRGFITLSKNILNVCARQNAPATIVLLDLNQFKAINDKFGHTEGDRALIKFSRYMTNTFRDSDILGRIGGDEFAVLLTNATIDYANEIIERLRQDVARATEIDNTGYDINFSVGIASIDDKQQPIEVLLDYADELMYKDKRETSPLN
jgi:diguanylate cyclase (GGDEF)-like protein